VIPRPFPPEHLHGGFGRFEPAPDVLRWARATFIMEDAPLLNEEHAHLREDCEIGFLWTNEPLERKGKSVIGTCQLMPPGGDAWTQARTAQQLDEWFPDRELDFLITLYAPWCADADHASFMALVEHELLHAAQKMDKWGAPSFNPQTGKPTWAIRGHDVQEFVSVVRRYGAGAAGSSVLALVDAANAEPEISHAQILKACGVCLKAVA
jgi:hypothetical protein